MWAFIHFAVIHIYQVFFVDWLDGVGEASAMLSGFKFVSEEQLKTEEA
jgi:Ni/Fe-hydrogenase 1 B-type cytochrome subunit